MSISTQRFTPEFKEEAVKQVTERGYSVTEVSARLGVSSHSLYKWVKAVSPDDSEKQAAELIEAKSEILRLKGACTEFCVNRHLAGNCHLVWRHNELEKSQRT